MKLDRICLFILACLIPAACADLDYSEENTRDEEWTYEYFENGIKNMVFDLYAQVYNNEFEDNSAYFLAGATDEARAGDRRHQQLRERWLERSQSVFPHLDEVLHRHRRREHVPGETGPGGHLLLAVQP